jgi:hypothetical protein
VCSNDRCEVEPEGERDSYRGERDCPIYAQGQKVASQAGGSDLDSHVSSAPTALPNGLELSCPAEAGKPLLLYGLWAGKTSIPEGAARRVSFSESLYEKPRIANRFPTDNASRAPRRRTSPTSPRIRAGTME